MRVFSLILGESFEICYFLSRMKSNGANWFWTNESIGASQAAL